MGRRGERASNQCGGDANETISKHRYSPCQIHPDEPLDTDCVAQFLTNFLTALLPAVVKPAKTLPWSSTAISSADVIAGSVNGMNATTLPSLTLPTRIPCLNPGLVLSSDCE